MHLFGLRIVEHVKRLFIPLQKNPYMPDDLADDAFPFCLNGVKLADAGQDMLRSRKHIPSDHFDGSWDDNVARSGRAVDKLDFLLYVVPTLLIPHVRKIESRRALNCLVMAIHMSLRWEFSTNDRRQIDK
jgi:hypothetical protein